MDVPLPPTTPGAAKDAASPEAAHAKAVADTVTEATPREKRKLAVDQRLLLNEVQLLLADKRTAFALLRTGMTVSLLPLSLWAVLVATSRLWDPFGVLWLLAPLAVVSLAFLTLGLYLIAHALNHMRHTDRVLAGLRQSDVLLEQLLFQESEALGRRLMRRLALAGALRRRRPGSSGAPRTRAP